MTAMSNLDAAAWAKSYEQASAVGSWWDNRDLRDHIIRDLKAQGLSFKAIGLAVGASGTWVSKRWIKVEYERLKRAENDKNSAMEALEARVKRLETLLNVSAETPPVAVAPGLSVDDLELDVRSSNCLRRAEIETIDQLILCTEDHLLNLPSFGKRSLASVKAGLASRNLSLASWL